MFHSFLHLSKANEGIYISTLYKYKSFSRISSLIFEIRLKEIEKRETDKAKIEILVNQITFGGKEKKKKKKDPERSFKKTFFDFLPKD